MTNQEVALKRARTEYGKTAFTEHHVNYCRVGFMRGTKQFSGIGDTWDEAFESLAGKVEDGKQV